MSVVLIGSIRADRLVDQPETEIEIDRYGVATASEVYECQWKDVLRLTAALTRHPDFTWLEKTRARISRQPADIARVTVYFEGLERSNSPTSPPPEATIFYELETTTAAEPIETHPRYTTVTDEERRKIEEAMKTRKAPTGLTARATELYQKKLKGIVSYLSPGVTWKQTITKAVSQLSGEQLNKVGDIDTPAGPVPQIAAGRNWLRGGTTQSIRGSAIQITHTWRLSGRRGWDPQLYDASAA